MDSSKESESVREILKPIHVDDSKIPKWVLDAIKEAVRSGKIEKPGFPLQAAGTAFDYVTRKLGKSWSDHTGRIKDLDGREYLVSEPYSEKINLEMIQELEAFVTLTTLDIDSRRILNTSRDGLYRS